MDIVGIKVLAGFLFFIDAFFFGCLPFFLVRLCLFAKTRTQNVNHGLVIQCLHSLASGVLIATCLLHLMPESLENVQHALLNHRRTTLQNKGGTENISTTDLNKNSEKDQIKDVKLYPVAELLVAIGFLVVFIIDTSIKAFQCTKKANHEVKYNQVKTYEDEDDENEIELYSQKERHSVKNGKSHYIKKAKSKNHISKSDSDSENIRHSEIENGSDGQETESGHVRSTALLMALCIHGFFDGVMLGLQTSSSVLYSLMMALLFHKSFVATSFSLTLLGNNSKGISRLRVLLYVLIFALVAPLGLAASAAFFHSSMMSSGGEDDFFAKMAPGCIQAFAVGTFLYVSFMETTKHNEELTALKYKILGHVCLLIGFSFMALIRMAVNDM